MARLLPMPDSGRPAHDLALSETLSHDRMLDREGKHSQSEYWSSESPQGMVATAHYLATKVGAETLASGGNAFDAAVTAALALGVCEPAGSGLGGMAILLAYDAVWDRTFVIEGACRAPQDATPDEVAHSNRYHGYQAVAVPTNLAVLDYTLRRYGTLTAADALEPALRIAQDGFPLTFLQHRNLAEYAETLRRGNAGHLFLTQDGPPPPGTLCRQPVLAETLRRLQLHGVEDFYHGAIGSAITSDMRANGGFVNKRDLASSQLYREAPPLAVQFGSGVIRSVGPPAGGLTLLQMLNMVAHVNANVDADTPDGAVLTAAIIRQARHDRRAYRLKTDPRGVGGAAKLLSPNYAARAARHIARALAADPVRSLNPHTPPQGEPHGETSHISVMDKNGNVVALTQSIERSFGAAVATPTLGFLYNGYLRAFKVRNRRHPHYLRPGTPARSNAAPTIGFRDGKPWVAIGSTGSERTSSGILQVLLRLARQDPFDAVLAPRLHCTPEGRVLLEAERFPSGCVEALVHSGFTLEPLEPYSFKMGGLQLVVKDDQTFRGVGEPRRDGAAAGPS